MVKQSDNFLEAERKLNVLKSSRTSWTPSDCYMYVKFTSCVQGGICS